MGKVMPPGQVAIAAIFQTPGFVKNGMIHGTMTVHGRQGSLSLSVTGPASGQTSSTTFRLTYKIIGGTGQFKNAAGSGSVVIAITPISKPGTAFPRLGHGKISVAFV